MVNRTVIILCILWGAVAASALAVSLLAAANETLSGDRAITEWLQDQPLPGQDLSDMLRALTTTEVVLAAGAIISLALWITRRRRQALLLGAGLAALVILQSGVKEIVDRPRPDPSLVDVRAARTSPSYPAGHVMSGSFLYGFLIYLVLTLPWPRWAAIVSFVAAAGVVVLAGPVNVWLGAHWPSDVIGGYLLAAVLLLPLLALAIWERNRT
jgi:membrane-associated phospholipid phosphatase